MCILPLLTHTYQTWIHPSEASFRFLVIAFLRVGTALCSSWRNSVNKLQQYVAIFTSSVPRQFSPSSWTRFVYTPQEPFIWRRAHGDFVWRQVMVLERLKTHDFSWKVIYISLHVKLNHPGRLATSDCKNGDIVTLMRVSCQPRFLPISLNLI